MADKRQRQATILELVEGHPVGSQEELRRLLKQRGWDVTQATLSRDLRELRLARVPTPEGTRYVVPGSAAAAAVAGPPDGSGLLDGLLRQLFVGVDGVGELLVIKTVRGGASALAESFDAESWPGVVGTIAGDDTILIICRSSAVRERLARRLSSLAGPAEE